MKIKLFKEYAEIEINRTNEFGGIWTYDNYLKIHKIMNGVNKGQIKILLNENETWEKHSMMFGSAIILDTKYINMPEILEITLGSIFRKVQTNTIESILYSFLENMGYDGIFFIRTLVQKLNPIFEQKIKNIPIVSDNLGDVFDKLKILKNEVFEYQKEHYDEYKMKKDSEKYNL